MSSKDTCIFCLEGSQPNYTLLYNVKCRCNFAFHKQCYDAYTRKTMCPMCRAEVGDFYTLDLEELPSTYQNYRPLPTQLRQQIQRSQQQPQEEPESRFYIRSNRIINILFFILIIVIFLTILIESLKSAANT